MLFRSRLLRSAPLDPTARSACAGSYRLGAQSSAPRRPARASSHAPGNEAFMKRPGFRTGECHSSCGELPGIARQRPDIARATAKYCIHAYLVLQIGCQVLLRLNSLRNLITTSSYLINGSTPDTPRMRPAIKAGLKPSIEAAKAYMR